jgi:hypothetical protein
MTISRLFSPCVFGHGHTIRTRDEDGHLALQCEACGDTIKLFEEPAIRGPKHDAARVAGAPMISAKRVQTRDRLYPRSA